MTASSDLLTVARAQALFVSDLSAGSAPTRPEIDAAVRKAVRAQGGTRRCAGTVAAAYGDYPELAAPRMTWALRTVRSVNWRKPASVRSVTTGLNAGADTNPAPARSARSVHTEGHAACEAFLSATHPQSCDQADAGRGISCVLTRPGRHVR